MNRVAIRVNLDPLKATTAFPYLGRMVTFNNILWASLHINMRKAQQRCGMVSKVLGNTGAPVKSHAMMYKAFVHSASVWELNMSGRGRDDDGPGRFSTYYFKTYYGYDGVEGRSQGMVVILGGRCDVGYRSMSD